MRRSRGRNRIIMITHECRDLGIAVLAGNMDWHPSEPGTRVISQIAALKTTRFCPLDTRDKGFWELCLLFPIHSYALLRRKKLPWLC
jgi:hypothetical protein